MQFPFVRTCQFIAIAALVTACGGGGGGESGGGNFGGTIGNGNTSPSFEDGTYRPADADSPYKTSIVNCVNIVNDKPISSCKLTTLPFIGQKSGTPTVADILAHTVVSHPWMATRFSQLLSQMPQDVLLLFRGVTAVVIGAKIRPSHYRSDTAAIYLDPENLWLTGSERSTISVEPDYRSGFSNGLAFRSLWRYVEGNDDAFKYFPPDGPSTRTINDIVRPMADLLFHELAHANDFMPPAYVSGVNPNLTPAAAIDAAESSFISSELKSQSPLNSQMQYGLAQVMYWGAKATDAQKQLLPQQVGLDFEVDGASDSYNYSSQFEDVAMLFEEVMMRYHYKVDREMAFTDAPSATGTCSEYVVRWGVRNRIGDPKVKARAQLIVRKILGVSNTDMYFAALPAPRSMKLGVDWCNNWTLNAHEDGMQKMSVMQVPERNMLPID